MLRNLGVRTSRLQFEGTVPERRSGSISVAFLNRENTKRLEFHEISHHGLERLGCFKCPFQGANGNSRFNGGWGK